MNIKLFMKKNCKIFFGFLIGVLLPICCVYAATVIDSKNVSYTDNSNLKASNVQEAIDNTCSNLNTKLNEIKSKDDKVTYTTPFTALPSGWSASAYKLNGVVVLTMNVPAGSSGWVTASSFSLISELLPDASINASCRYSSYSDINKAFFSLNSDGTIYGLVNGTLNYIMVVQFVYPLAS